MSETRKIFATQLFTGAISLISMVAMARYLGPGLFGFSAAIVLILSVGIDVVDFGACSWAARELAKGSLVESEYLQIMKIKVRTELIFLTLGPVIICLNPTGSPYSLLFLVYPYLWIRTNYVQQFLMCNSKIEQAMSLQILERLSWLLIFPFAFLNFNKEISYIAPILTGLFLHGFIGIHFINRTTERNRSNPKLKLSSLYRKSKHFGVTSVLSDSSNLDSPLIASFSTFADSASYSLTQRFRNPLQIFFQSFSTRLRPVSSTRNRSQISNLIYAELKFLTLGVFSIVCLSVLAYLFAPIVFGQEYSQIGLIMSVGTLTAIPIGISSIGTSFLASVGGDKEVAQWTTILTAVLLLGIIFSVINFGSIGAVVFVLIANIIFSIVISFYALRQYSLL
jgi:O-antigen/teichoic acid export membrane protein